MRYAQFSKVLVLAALFAVLGFAAQAAITDDLVCYLSFDETSGSILSDTSPGGSDNDGEVVGDDLSVTSEAGVIGNAYRLPADGTDGDDFVTIDGNTADGARTASISSDFITGTNGDSLSWACWIDTTNLALNQRVMGNVDWTIGGASVDRTGIGYLGGSTTSFQVRTYPDDSTGFANTGVGSLPNGWIHVAHVVDMDFNVARTYINGVEINSASLVNPDTGVIGDLTTPWVLVPAREAPTTRTPTAWLLTILVCGAAT